MRNVSRVVDSETDCNEEVHCRHCIDRQTPEVHQTCHVHLSSKDAKVMTSLSVYLDCDVTRLTYEAHDDADADEEAGPQVCEQNESGEENADESEAQVAIEFLLDDLKSTKL